MFTIVSGPIAAHGSKRKQITCTTCALKKCIGRCHWERIENPRPKKAA